MTLGEKPARCRERRKPVGATAGKDTTRPCVSSVKARKAEPRRSLAVSGRVQRRDERGPDGGLLPPGPGDRFPPSARPADPELQHKAPPARLAHVQAERGGSGKRAGLLGGPWPLLHECKEALGPGAMPQQSLSAARSRLPQPFRPPAFCIAFACRISHHPVSFFSSRPIQARLLALSGPGGGRGRGSLLLR